MQQVGLLLSNSQNDMDYEQSLTHHNGIHDVEVIFWMIGHVTNNPHKAMGGKNYEWHEDRGDGTMSNVKTKMNKKWTKDSKNMIILD